MQRLLEASHVSVSIRGKQIVRDISFSLEEGSILMLVGPNGAGKSTLLSAVSGVLPFTGDVRMHGRDIRSMSSREIALCMGLLMQRNPGSFDYTVEDVVRLGRYASRRSPFARAGVSDEKVQEALVLTGMEKLCRNPMRTLSGGEMQRAFLAQVFAQDPDILLLDEPANHLDFLYQRDIFSLIERWRHQGGKAVLCVVHDLGLARKYADSVLLMHGGCCQALGAPDAVFSREQLEQVYGMDVHAWMRSLYEPWQSL